MTSRKNRKSAKTLPVKQSFGGRRILQTGRKGCGMLWLAASVFMLTVGLKAPVCLGQSSDILSREEVSELGKRFEPLRVIQFEETDLGVICKIVSDTTGLSVFLSPSVKEKVGIWARDINPIELLDRACEAAGVTYFVTAEAINVVTWDEYQERFGLAKEVVRLNFAEAAQLTAAVQPFLSKKGKIVAHAESNALVILETPAALPKILDIVKALDVEMPEAIVKVMGLRYVSAAKLAEQVQKVFSDESARSGRRGPGVSGHGEAQTDGPTKVEAVVAPGRAVLVLPEARTNSLILKGHESDVARVQAIVEQLDVPVETVVQSYPLVYVDAGEVFENLLGFLGLQKGDLSAERDLKVYLSSQTNAITVSGTKIDQERVRGFLSQVDVPIPEVPSGVRVYRLENVSADKVAKVISDLLSEEQGKSEGQPGTKRSTAPSAAGQGKMVEPPGSTDRGIVKWGSEQASTGESGSPEATAEQEKVEPAAAVVERPVVTVSEEANAIVIRATAQQHQELRRLIEELDQPRAQVMIEAIIVQITATDDSALGVELESANLDAETGHLVFSSFGLSTIDAKTGKRVLIPAAGFNAAIVRPDYVPVILRALETVANARITSAPRLLVNDNCMGVIDSVQEEPYTSVNASQTVSTTSFAGFVEAGTTFAITPHISESNFIRLEYALTLNTFTGEAVEAGVPPPRATDSVTSEAVVPDGHTIIVGGLRGTLDRRTVNRIPILGRIPLLRYLFRSVSTEKANSTFFVFIKPTILRDRQFETLKFLSGEQRSAAGIKEDYPRNEIKAIGE